MTERRRANKNLNMVNDESRVGGSSKLVVNESCSVKSSAFPSHSMTEDTMAMATVARLCSVLKAHC